MSGVSHCMPMMMVRVEVVRTQHINVKQPNGNSPLWEFPEKQENLVLGFLIIILLHHEQYCKFIDNVHNCNN